MTSSSSSTDAHVKLRSSFSQSSSSLHALLLSSLNLLLLVLASASFAPLFLLRTSPTSFGWTLFAVSFSTALSALLSLLSSHLTRPCFAAHLLLVLAASVGQALGFLTLLLRPGPSLRLLGSARGARDQRALARVEAALLLGMFLMQSLALVTACTLRQRWVRQFEEMEADREAAAGRRSRRMARVQEEAIANAAAAARELEEKLRNKKGQWVKNDLEGRKISPVDF
ncbi:uncharacterized protein LOC122019541 [Zingiber officinale]|uniref:uncharacterized protein LOC122019541 n=1 Tax=Zingiber officinale TaxID=94328 RepID=UPI001C4B820A|nr:uncharacterized protein LOC122019541 [Zingiber officinale]